MAILSIEETGKFHFSLDTGTSTKNARHKSKQYRGGQALLDMLGVDQVRALAAQAGYDIKLVRRPRNSAQLDPVAFIAQKLPHISVNSSQVRNSKQVELLLRLLKGEFSILKNQCFYVDPGQGVPSELVDRRSADECIRLANGVLWSTHARLRYDKAYRVRLRQIREAIGLGEIAALD